MVRTRLNLPLNRLLINGHWRRAFDIATGSLDETTAIGDLMLLYVHLAMHLPHKLILITLLVPIAAAALADFVVSVSILGRPSEVGALPRSIDRQRRVDIAQIYVARLVRTVLVNRIQSSLLVGLHGDFLLHRELLFMLFGC